MELLTDCESLSERDKDKEIRSESVRLHHWTFIYLLSKRKLTGGRKTEVFLFSTGGVVELENVQDGLRILFLF